MLLSRRALACSVLVARFLSKNASLTGVLVTLGTLSGLEAKP